MRSLDPHQSVQGRLLSTNNTTAGLAPGRDAFVAGSNHQVLLFALAHSLLTNRDGQGCHCPGHVYPAIYVCTTKPLCAWTLHSAHTLEISHGGGLKQFHESKSRLLAVWAIKLKPSGFLLISSLPATYLISVIVNVITPVRMSELLEPLALHIRYQLRFTITIYCAAMREAGICSFFPLLCCISVQQGPGFRWLPSISCHARALLQNGNWIPEALPYIMLLL